MHRMRVGRVEPESSAVPSDPMIATALKPWVIETQSALSRTLSTKRTGSQSTNQSSRGTRRIACWAWSSTAYGWMIRDTVGMSSLRSSRPPMAIPASQPSHRREVRIA